MDCYYNKDEARKTIDQLTQEQCSKDMLHLARLMQDPKALKDVRMQYDKNGQIWRLVKEDRHGEIEEIVFTMMGTLWASDLPPITRETT
ncbi:hypothetical protein ARMGADRAFT_1079116 [Armillaria gallica]|uniref:Uncharacterized protein n=1 Tax=Armillaria gallica TaxID=47427 RepID=A0A2H3DKQ6_ARMGA|nr:hypothetical protein ARMGADRAFT_1079116 [Armillaria gallica]